MIDKEHKKVFLIVSTAIAIRVFFLLLQRPEFVCWFNHTYYYYVEVKGLLEQGNLPFKDMPLLFYLYAFTAKFLGLIGFDTDNAIVYSTRLLMSIIPSLLPIPTYAIIKNISKYLPIQKSQWVFIISSGFLPLSIIHMPEFLQKNALGILLLITLVYYSQKLIREYKTRDVLISAALILAIILTHFGTTGAMVLYGASLLLASFFTNKDVKQFLIYGSVLILTLIGSLLAFYLFDIQRFERIFIYLFHSIEHSFLGVLFSANSATSERFNALSGIVLPGIVIAFFILIFRKYQSSLSKENRLFWLTNIIFCYLLVLPVWEMLLMARFVLFLSIPLLIIFAFQNEYVIKRVWIKYSVLSIIFSGILLMAFGEILSTKFHGRDNDEIYADLMALKRDQIFQKNDLVITKNGAEHICIWFLNVKSGVITSLNRSDFDKYDNIYVLNPIEGELNFQGIENKKATNETDKYIFMLRNIPKPENAVTIYESEYIEFFRLDASPLKWSYDSAGNWIGYTE